MLVPLSLAFAARSREFVAPNAAAATRAVALLSARPRHRYTRACSDEDRTAYRSTDAVF